MIRSSMRRYHIYLCEGSSMRLYIALSMIDVDVLVRIHKV